MEVKLSVVSGGELVLTATRLEHLVETLADPLEEIATSSSSSSSSSSTSLLDALSKRVGILLHIILDLIPLTLKALVLVLRV